MPEAVVLPIRLVRNLLAFVAVAFAMTAPATAWDAHEISHIASPVAVDEHHHHGDGEVQASHHHDSGSPSEEDDGDGGHDHMPSLLAALNGILGAAPVAMLPPLTVVTQPAFAVKVPVDLIEPPPARPPRTV